MIDERPPSPKTGVLRRYRGGHAHVVEVAYGSGQEIGPHALLEAAGGAELLEAMREHGTILDATLSAASKLRAPPDWVKPLACGAQVVRAAREAGVRVATGSDHGGEGDVLGIHMEYELLVSEAGLTPLAVIEAATRISAAAIGIEDRRGTIEIGKEATLLVLAQDPTLSVKALATPDFVIKRGVVYSGPDLREPGTQIAPLEFK